LKIGYIYLDDYPWDIRVEKIASSLAQNKHETHLIVANVKGLETFEKLNENFYIHRLKNVNKHLKYIYNLPLFISPIWISKIHKITKRYKLDLIIVRELPLSPAALLVGRLLNVPVMMDMAENYPALIASTWKYRGAKFLDYIFKNPYLLRKLEKFSTKKMDSILVVSEHSKNRIAEFIKNKNKINVVSNTPILDENQEQDKVNYKEIESIKSRSTFILAYTGYISEHRGIDTVIDAIPILKSKIRDVLFLVIGEGAYKQKLIEKTKSLNLENHVHFTGWIDHKKINQLISVADICLIPHYVTEHVNTTIPNKIFDYMYQKKPVLATQSQSLKEIVETSGCGLIYIDDQPESLVQNALKLKDIYKRETIGEKGYKAVLNKYNWSKDLEVLLESVQAVINNFEN